MSDSEKKLAMAQQEKKDAIARREKVQQELKALLEKKVEDKEQFDRQHNAAQQALDRANTEVGEASVLLTSLLNPTLAPAAPTAPKGPAQPQQAAEEKTAGVDDESKGVSADSDALIAAARAAGAAAAADAFQSLQQELNAQRRALLSIRLSTAELQAEVRDARVDADFCKELETVDEKTISRLWAECRDIRERIGKVDKEVAKLDKDTGEPKEDDVCNLMNRLCDIVCSGSTLVHRDTHSKNAPSRNLIDHCFVDADSNAADLDARVTFGELDLVGEDKLSLAADGIELAACGQIRDRISEIAEAQMVRERFFGFICDKSSLRLFKWTRRDELWTSDSRTVQPFLSTAAKPTPAFRRFCRLLRSSPEQLGRADIPPCPHIGDDPADAVPQFLLRQGTAHKATLFRSVLADSEAVTKVFTNQAAFAGELAALKRNKSAPVPQIIKEDAKELFIVTTPFGTPLRDVEYSEELLIKVGRALGQVLTCSHQQGFAHGDLSPDQIIVCGEGKEQSVTVNDWGSSRRFGLCRQFSGTYFWCSPLYGMAFLEGGVSEHVLKPADDYISAFLTLAQLCAMPSAASGDAKARTRLPFERTAALQCQSAKLQFLLKPNWKLLTPSSVAYLKPLLRVVMGGKPAESLRAFTDLAALKLSVVPEDDEDLFHLLEELKGLSVSGAAASGPPSTPAKPAVGTAATAGAGAGAGAQDEHKAVVLKSPPKKGPKLCGVRTAKVPHHPCKKPAPCPVHKVLAPQA